MDIEPHYKVIKLNLSIVQFEGLAADIDAIIWLKAKKLIEKKDWPRFYCPHIYSPRKYEQ